MIITSLYHFFATCYYFRPFYVFSNYLYSYLLSYYENTLCGMKLNESKKAMSEIKSRSSGISI